MSSSLKLVTNKEVYRPGESVIATIEICNTQNLGNDSPSILVDNLGSEIKGMERLDPQWFSTEKPLPGSKQKRGTCFLHMSHHLNPWHFKPMTNNLAFLLDVRTLRWFSYDKPLQFM